MVVLIRPVPKFRDDGEDVAVESHFEFVGDVAGDRDDTLRGHRAVGGGNVYNVDRGGRPIGRRGYEKEAVGCGHGAIAPAIEPKGVTGNRRVWIGKIERRELCTINISHIAARIGRGRGLVRI